MHRTALEYGKEFFDLYIKDKLSNGIIVDIGSQDVNGSLKSVAPLQNNKYIGVDYAWGKGVDVVLTDPYVLPFSDNFCEVIVSSSCLEHSEFFWLTFNEMARILKPNGFIYINVPTNCWYHAYPVDCWRFYKDSGKALEKWAVRSGHKIKLVESFVGISDESNNNDYVAIFTKEL